MYLNAIENIKYGSLNNMAEPEEHEFLLAKTKFNTQSFDTIPSVESGSLLKSPRGTGLMRKMLKGRKAEAVDFECSSVDSQRRQSPGSLSRQVTASASVHKKFGLDLPFKSASFPIQANQSGGPSRRQTDEFTMLKLREGYERFVPVDFLHLLHQEDITDVSAGMYRKMELSVLFTDIRSFTAISEKIGPSNTMDLLNEIFMHLSPVIRINNGFIDKFIGDAIMALFTTSLEALQCSVGLQRVIRDYNTQRREAGLEPVLMGIGISTGTVTLGTVGDKLRMDATAIGNPVNEASRVESLTKRYGCPTIVTAPSLVDLPIVEPTEHFLRFSLASIRAPNDGPASDSGMEGVRYTVAPADPLYGDEYTHPDLGLEESKSGASSPDGSASGDLTEEITLDSMSVPGSVEPGTSMADRATPNLGGGRMSGITMTPEPRTAPDVPRLDLTATQTVTTETGTDDIEDGLVSCVGGIEIATPPGTYQAPGLATGLGLDDTSFLTESPKARKTQRDRETPTSARAARTLDEMQGLSNGDGRIFVRLLDTVCVVGKEDATHLFEVIDPRSIPCDLDEFLDNFWNGVMAFREGRFEEATDKFEACRVDHPTDRPTRIYLARLARLAERMDTMTEEECNDLRAGFDCIVRFDTK